jgi:exodeoxyribonuclease VII large subunit
VENSFLTHVFSVSELSRAIKEALEPSFPVVWVRGQVSNISRPGSGHIYFTLKDEQAIISAAWFRNNHAFSLDHKGKSVADSLQEGSEVVCAGRLSVYPPRGTYQLIPELVQEQGMGDLHMRFEALKKKLKAEGLFSGERKKPLPFCPQKVAVITAANGAALQDFLHVSEQYGLGGEILVYPVHVQGDRAQKEIVSALARANTEARAEVLLLIRGGGSLEDLWPFNTEEVARAVFASRLPVVTGIGHEVDTSIADLVADVRAATPTHAVRTIWPERKALEQRTDELTHVLKVNGAEFVRDREAVLMHKVQALTWLSPQKQLDRTLDRLKEANKRLHHSFAGYINSLQNTLAELKNRLIRIYTPRFWNYRQQHLDILAHDLVRAASSFLTEHESRYSVLSERLIGLDPYRPLEKGYALVRQSGEKDFIRDCEQVTRGDDLDIQVRKGKIFARVTGGEKEE